MRCVRPLFCLLCWFVCVIVFSFWATEKKLDADLEGTIHIFLTAAAGCCAISCLSLLLSLALVLEATEK